MKTLTEIRQPIAYVGKHAGPFPLWWGKSPAHSNRPSIRLVTDKGRVTKPLGTREARENLNPCLRSADGSLGGTRTHTCLCNYNMSMRKCISGCTCLRHKSNPPPIQTVKSCGKAHSFCHVCRPDMKFFGGGRPAFSLLEDLERNSYKAERIKRKLVQEGYLENICGICRMPPEWNGKPLVFHLDHINGIHTDNRIENFRLMCPNCHSQTETFSWRNVRRKKLEASVRVELTSRG